MSWLSVRGATVPWAETVSRIVSGVTIVTRTRGVRTWRGSTSTLGRVASSTHAPIAPSTRTAIGSSVRMR